MFFLRLILSDFVAKRPVLSEGVTSVEICHILQLQGFGRILQYSFESKGRLS